MRARQTGELSQISSELIFLDNEIMFLISFTNSSGVFRKAENTVSGSCIETVFIKAYSIQIKTYEVNTNFNHKDTKSTKREKSLCPLYLCG
jgi:hypothetical protein